MSAAAESVEIFFLDDMEDIIIITEHNLRRENLKLDITFFLDETDMLSALEARRNRPSPPPDMIVTDLNMPGRGGVHLVKALREDAFCEQIAIVVCTSSENPADHDACLSAGADFVVLKPFDRSTLDQICEKTGRFQLIQRDDGKDYLCPARLSSEAA
ncbi:MAG: response regulator [Pseudomonadota bacterium]